MADEPQQYTNADLDTAETLLIAAGQPELAKALRFYTEGNRNMVQGVWGQLSVDAMEGVLTRLGEGLRRDIRQEVAPISDRLDRSNRAILDWRTELREQIDQQTTVFSGELDTLLKDTKELRAGQSALHAGFREVGERLDTFEHTIHVTVARVAKLEQRVESVESRVELLERIAAEDAATETAAAFIRQLREQRGYER